MEALFEFPSVAEAVAYLTAHGYKTVLEDAGPDHCRLMRGAVGDIAVIRHEGLLNAKVYEDCGYWEDKLADWLSDGADLLGDYY
jgi:hypothetical protein